jgi:hypothetical protein
MRPYTGAIGDVRLYDRVLSDVEVANEARSRRR